jgi:hypothetical protein
MTPETFPDGVGFKTIVKLADGRHALISEIHRNRLDETMVFICDSGGKVTDWGEIYGIPEGTTADAISDVSRWRR